MLEELIMGYDCREMWMPNVEQWSEEQRKHHLIKPDIERYLSAARLLWHTIFIFSPSLISRPYYTVPDSTLHIPMLNITHESMWNDLAAMESMISQNLHEIQKPCWSIAVTLVVSPNYVEELDKEYEDRSRSIMIVRPSYITPEIVSADWELLGYDVEDSGLGHVHGLVPGFAGGFRQQDLDLIRPKYQKYLNKYSLFDDQSIAVDFGAFLDAYEPGIGTPFCVFGLYKIREWNDT